MSSHGKQALKESVRIEFFERVEALVFPGTAGLPRQEGLATLLAEIDEAQAWLREERGFVQALLLQEAKDRVYAEAARIGTN